MTIAVVAADPGQAKGPQKLAASVQPFVDRQELAGAVMLVANKDRVLALEAAGWADIAAKKPMQPDSLFWIASQSKPITAAAPLGMKDTTFWPSEEQIARLAKAYKPGSGGKGLLETTIDQIHYPLNDRTERFPMPAGGLFSTAHDLARFYQMLLSGGRFDGKRLLSEASVKQMTSRQTPPRLAGYGFGIGAGDKFFGHGGAYSTNTSADTVRGLIFVWLVQHAGFPGEGGKAQDAFKKAAIVGFAGK